MALDALRAPEYLVCAVPGAGDQGKLNLVDRINLTATSRQAHPNCGQLLA